MEEIKMSDLKDFLVEDGVLKKYLGNESLVRVPEDVTTIGNGVLEGKPFVTDVYIPSSVKKINFNAFFVDYESRPLNIHIDDIRVLCDMDCPYGIFPNSFSENNIILNGELLQELVIPNEVMEVKPHVFKGAGIKKLIISEGVTSIGESAFEYCKNLKHIVLPKTIVSIGKNAFNVFGLEKIEIPDDASLKRGNWFDGILPQGLSYQVEQLSLYMDANAVKGCLIKSSLNHWDNISYYSKALIYLACQDKEMKKLYKKKFKPVDTCALAEEFVNILKGKVSKKECTCVAEFMANYYATIDASYLKQLFDVIGAQKVGADAIKMILENAGLKKKIESAKDVTVQSKCVNGFDTEEDRVIANMGFDDDGTKIYDLGNKKVAVSINSKLTFDIIDLESNKISKTIPKRGADAELYDAAKADLQAIQKTYKQLLKTYKSKLLELYFSGEWLELRVWQKQWQTNFITKALSQSLVWQQEDSFFSFINDSTVDENGKVYTLRDKPIRIAYVSDMYEKTINNWQKLFVSNQKTQAFLQIWENSYKAEDINTDRYSDCVIKSVYLINRKEIGIDCLWYNRDVGYDEITYRSLYIDGFEVKASGNDEGTELTIDEIVVKEWSRKSNTIVSFLDKITIYSRILNNRLDSTNELKRFTLAQISDFIRIANENNATNALAILLDYKNKNFADFDPMDEFVLE